MGEAVLGEMHRCTPECARLVRCIICNRIKSPRGAAVPANLLGMRCEPGCLGYELDPRPGHLWPAMVTEPPRPEPDVVALLAWALHDAFPPAARVVGGRRPVVYQVACLLMGEDVARLIAALVQAGCRVAQTCQALGSVVLEVAGDALVIIAQIDAWDGSGSIEIVPPPGVPTRTAERR